MPRPTVTPPRRALLFGAGGMLANALSAELPRQGWTVEAVARGQGDIRDQTTVRELCARVRPSVVFNAAAYTDVDRAESEPEVAHAVNATGAGIVARAAADVGAVVVHYSTDFVFDGELERPYDERDLPSPQGTYARSKLAGDHLVSAATPHHVILRVGCLYGRGGRNFPSTVVRRLRAGEVVRADRDRLGSPTWVNEVARVSATVAVAGAYGLFHCTSHGETSWVDFAREAARLLGRPQTQVEAVATASLPFKAPRPRRAVLDNRALRELGLDGLSTWQEALAAFIADESQPEGVPT